jgi:uncharacterized surface protein with fasciclin (FAS1) repeats
LTSPANKTLLTPTDAAINKILPDLKTLPSKAIESILLYHVVNGTISYRSTPDVFDYHIIAPTYLNDTNFTHLPRRKKQVLVFSRPDSNDPIHISYGANDTSFVSRTDGPVVGNIQIQVIDDVLIPPGNFSQLAAEDKTDLAAIQGALKQSNLTPSIQAAKGVTIFAPTTQALTSALANQRVQLTDREVMMTLLNHVINGTILFSSQFPASESQNGPVSTKTTSLRTAAGMTLSFRYLKDGTVEVFNSNYTAKIVKSDVLIANGVVHYIDGVIVNGQYNMSAGANTTDQVTASQALPSVQAQSVQAAASAHQQTSSGAMRLLATANVFVVAPFTVVLAALLTLV